MQLLGVLVHIAHANAEELLLVAALSMNSRPLSAVWVNAKAICFDIEIEHLAAGSHGDDVVR